MCLRPDIEDSLGKPISESMGWYTYNRSSSNIHVHILYEDDVAIDFCWDCGDPPEGTAAESLTD
ncbi:hypothetical protein H4219_003122 [Mycoemilia scoparia]|uniref:Uncharacterized protein n=1 Tax=Mycoemilia scoparia TaxID=417184 RepID=A0A9W8A289_9FUNG|nr:hypothetical protein H4219_003122 [Mycoemilia scoparia]